MGGRMLAPVATTLERLGVLDAAAVAQELVDAEGTPPDHQALLILDGLKRREAKQRVEAQKAAAVTKVKAALSRLPAGTLRPEVNRDGLARELAHIPGISTSEEHFAHNLTGALQHRADLLTEQALRSPRWAAALKPEPTPIDEAFQRSVRYSTF